MTHFFALSARSNRRRVASERDAKGPAGSRRWVFLVPSPGFQNADRPTEIFDFLDRRALQELRKPRERYQLSLGSNRDHQLAKAEDEISTSRGECAGKGEVIDQREVEDKLYARPGPLAKFSRPRFEPPASSVRRRWPRSGGPTTSAT